MNSPSFYRSRILMFEKFIEQLPVDNGKKNTPRELLKQGYWDQSLGDQEILIRNYQRSNSISNDTDLKLSEITRFSTWFAMHPEKIAGSEKVTSSLFFPVKIEGTEQDVIRVIKEGIANLNKSIELPRKVTTNILIMRMKAKALKLKLSLADRIPDQDKKHFFVTRQNTDLQTEYDKYNNLIWNGSLIRVPLQWGMNKSKAGCVRSHGIRNDIRSFIVDFIEISLFNKIDYQSFVDTLVHEMIHVYIITNHIKDNDSHGHEFKKEMDRINGMKLGINITITANVTGIDVSDQISAKEFVVTLVYKNNIPAGITIYNKALYNDVPRWYNTKFRNLPGYHFKHILSNEVNLQRYKSNMSISQRYYPIEPSLWAKLEASRTLEGIKPELEEIRYITIY